jgi:hypothetical protein
MTELELEVQTEAKLKLRQGIRAAQFSSLFFVPQRRLQSLGHRQKLVKTEFYR